MQADKVFDFIMRNASYPYLSLLCSMYANDQTKYELVTKLFLYDRASQVHVDDQYIMTLLCLDYANHNNDSVPDKYKERYAMHKSALIQSAIDCNSIYKKCNVVDMDLNVDDTTLYFDPTHKYRIKVVWKKIE
jgi:hypothetical protein